MDVHNGGRKLPPPSGGGGGGSGMVAATVMVVVAWPRHGGGVGYSGGWMHPTVVRWLFFFLEPFSCVGWHPHGKVSPPLTVCPTSCLFLLGAPENTQQCIFSVCAIKGARRSAVCHATSCRAGFAVSI